MNLVLKSYVGDGGGGGGVSNSTLRSMLLSYLDIVSHDVYL